MLGSAVSTPLPLFRGEKHGRVKMHCFYWEVLLVISNSADHLFLSWLPQGHTINS